MLFIERIPKMGHFGVLSVAGVSLSGEEVDATTRPVIGAPGPVYVGCFRDRASARRFAIMVYADELNERPMCVPGTSKS